MSGKGNPLKNPFFPFKNPLSSDSGNAAIPIPTPSPSPTAVPGRDEEVAKKKARRRGRTGRESTILAGRLMSSTGNILNTKLG